MNNTKFSRELKTLIYYLREYGIQHIDFKFNSLDSLPKEQVQIDQFMTQVHQGFFAAQDRTIYLLKKILQEQKRLKVSLAKAIQSTYNDFYSLGNIANRGIHTTMFIYKSTDTSSMML